MRIAVAGGTGVVGRHVVRVAEERGHEPVVLARSQGVDLTTGAGLAGRLDGVDAVVDVTSVRTQSKRKAMAFFGDITGNLLTGESAAGVGHHVALSIVGIDEVPFGYYEGKLEQERIIAAGEVPWTILRATQFHEFAHQVLFYAGFGKVAFVPQMLSQPIAAAEAGEALVDLVEAGPSGAVPDLAGPEKLQMVDMARRLVKARGLGRRIIPIRLPGATGKGLRSGALTPSTDGPRGKITFDEWLGQGSGSTTP